MMMMEMENMMYIVNLGVQFIGSAETTLANIAGAKDQLIMLDLTDGHKKTGVIVIRADQVRMINDKIIM